MNIRVEPTPQPAPTPQEDRWYYGWRYENQTGPDGLITTVQVPLTEEDVLHPQEDDFIVQNPAHEEDCHYLRTLLVAHLAGQAGVHVFRDLRMDWGVADIEPHGPDLAVIANVPEERPFQMGTLHLAEVAARPLLVIEVTSPTTRKADLNAKVAEYYEVGVPFYAIVDRHEGPKGELTRLLAYRATPDGYELLGPDADGWLALEPVGLALAFEGRNLVCRDAQGRRLLNYQEVVQARQQAEARAQAAEAQVATEVQARQAAEARATAEVQARQIAEERIRRLEAELNRQRGQS
jgi:colicin import membrane protein